MRALAAALLLAAAPAAAAPHEVVLTTACTPSNLWQLETSLTSLLRNFLYSQTGPRAAETSGYFSTHPNAHLKIGFPPEQKAQFPDRPPTNGAFMYFDPMSPDDRPEFVIAHSFLHTNGSNEADLIADPARLRPLMESVADVFVHEARHAMTKRMMDPKDPEAAAPTFVEDETTAWYAGFLFLVETLESDPGYDRLAEAAPLLEHHGDLLRAGKTAEADALLEKNPWLTNSRADKVLMLSKLRRSNAEFEAKIRALYKTRPPVDDDAAVKREAAHDRAEAADLERSQISLDEIVARRTPSDPDTYRQAVDLRVSGARLIAHLQGMQKYLESPAHVGEARAFFHKVLAVLRAEADDRRVRDAALLSAFDYKDPDEDKKPEPPKKKGNKKKRNG